MRLFFCFIYQWFHSHRSPSLWSSDTIKLKIIINTHHLYSFYLFIFFAAVGSFLNENSDECLIFLWLKKCAQASLPVVILHSPSIFIFILLNAVCHVKEIFFLICKECFGFSLLSFNWNFMFNFCISHVSHCCDQQWEKLYSGSQGESMEHLGGGGMATGARGSCSHCFPSQEVGSRHEVGPR